MVIVIGATGFIGMYTVDRFLEEGYEVLATGRNAFYWQVCFRQMHRWISVQMRMPQTISALMWKEPLMY